MPAFIKFLNSGRLLAIIVINGYFDILINFKDVGRLGKKFIGTGLHTRAACFGIGIGR
jgi:hypothetical protein